MPARMMKEPQLPPNEIVLWIKQQLEQSCADIDPATRWRLNALRDRAVAYACRKQNRQAGLNARAREAKGSGPNNNSDLDM